VSTTVNVCPERASGDSPFRGASSHVTDCRWLGRRGVRVSTSVHWGPRPEHVVHKAVDRPGSATQRPESSVVLQTDPVGCCPPSKTGGDRVAQVGPYTGQGRTMGPAQTPSPDRRCGSLFVNQVGVRLLPSRANLRVWRAGLTPLNNRKLASLRIPDLASCPAADWQLLPAVFCNVSRQTIPATDRRGRPVILALEETDAQITMTSTTTPEESLEFAVRYPASETLLGFHDYEAFSKLRMPDSWVPGEHAGPSESKDSIHMCGWLDKYYTDDRGTKTWRPRWVYLLEDRLCYGSATSTDNVPPQVKYIMLDRLPARPGGKLAISRLKVSPQGLNGQPGVDCAFHLVCDNRTHTFAGKTPEVALRWTEKLEELAMKRLSATNTLDALRVNLAS